VADAQRFAASFSITPDAIKYTRSLNLTSYQTEMNAYRVTHSVYARGNQLFGGLLGAGIKASSVEGNIETILLKNYGVTRTKQGELQIPAWR
jgi:hypothetical protein